MCDHMQKPCKKCPFSVTCPPGELGGSAPEVYMGQAFGPFVLPCHAQKDYESKKWDLLNVSQCAGAAIFRHHIGVAPYMPSAIHHLPASETVFASPAHFYAHHKGISLTEASAQLRSVPPAHLLAVQMGRPTNKTVIVKEAP